MDKPEIREKLEINHDRILKKMYQQYLQTENKSIESNLLFAFYNFALSGIPQAEQNFMEFQYEEMLLKTYTNNVLDFLDLCVAVIYNYPNERVYEQIVFGGKIKFIDLICEHLADRMSSQIWRLLIDLGQALELGI